MAHQSKGGIVYTAKDGTTYFIRNEILDLCRVEPEYEKETLRMVEHAGKSHDAFVQPVHIDPSQSGFEKKPNLEPEILRSGIDAKALNRTVVGSTIMCCW
ncbi:MAG TPA: hypothetical protein VFJ85_13085 [Acidimicrobiales bacterium]|nr:hypothetical protein [Acidimicrobiales bacterium]